MVSLTVQNAGKPFGGSAPDSAGDLRPCSWRGGGSLPSNLGSSGLIPCHPKSLYQNLPILRTLTDCLMFVFLYYIRADSTVLLP